jgi:homoaconitase/3-isopropylmalate dehydratase large subunit
MGTSCAVPANAEVRPDAKFDAVVELDATQILPQVSWGTSPERPPINDIVPDPDKEKDVNKRDAIRTSAEIHGPAARRVNDLYIDRYSSAVAPTAALKTCAKPRHRQENRPKVVKTSSSGGGARFWLVKAQASKEI